MGDSAGRLEQEIDDALATRKATAQGLFLIMKRVILHPENRRPGWLAQNGKAVDVDSLADKANLSKETVSKLLRQLKAAQTRDSCLSLLDEDGDHAIYSPALKELDHRRNGERDRKRRERERRKDEAAGVTSRQSGVTSAGCPPDVTGESPPDGFSPTPPLPYPPSSTHSAGEDQGKSAVTDSQFSAALNAMEHWSRKSLGHGFSGAGGEERAVRILLDALSQATPVLWQGEHVEPHKLVPAAIDVMVRDGKDFKAISYASSCVKNRLEEWAKRGVPGAKPASHPPRRAVPVTTGARDFGPSRPGKETHV